VDALERLTNLVALLLETREPLTLEQIVDELDGQYPPSAVARRSAFERDKALLRGEGVPIRQVVLTGRTAGQTGYWIERSDFEISDVGLTTAERQALQVALATVHLGASWGHEAWWKFERADDEPPDDPIPVAATLPVHEALPTLHGALHRRAEIGFVYRGRRRRLRPYGLLSRDGQWYVTGWDCDAEALRSFRVDRFDDPGVDVGEAHTFERPADFRASQAFPADAREVGDPGDGPRTARVLVDGSRVALVLVQGGGADVVERRDDGAVVVEVPCVNRGAFRAWLFDLGPEAQVLSPPEVRDEVVAWLEAVSQGSPS
jgi:predicted DNA-binding transcriptional regulator YafY